MLFFEEKIVIKICQFRSAQTLDKLDANIRVRVVNIALMLAFVVAIVFFEYLSLCEMEGGMLMLSIINAVKNIEISYFAGVLASVCS